MKSFFPRNINLKYIPEVGIASPYFDEKEERQHFEKIESDFEVTKIYKNPENYYQKKYLEPYSSTICVNSKNKKECCKNHFPQNDFAYYSCTNSKNWSENKKNNKVEIIFFLLINIVIFTCYIMPQTDLYKRL